MGILKWFDTAEIDELARSIAAELAKRVPLSSLNSDTKQAADQFRNTPDAIFARAEKFAMS